MTADKDALIAELRQALSELLDASEIYPDDLDQDEYSEIFEAAQDRAAAILSKSAPASRQDDQL